MGKKAKRQKQFVAREGSPWSDAQAARYGVELARLQVEYGAITAEVVVEEAKNSRSPLHDAFAWDDTLAASRWRMHQARDMIGAIKVVYDDNGAEKSIREFLNVQLDEKDGGRGRSRTASPGGPLPLRARC